MYYNYVAVQTSRASTFAESANRYVGVVAKSHTHDTGRSAYHSSTLSHLLPIIDQYPILQNQ